MPIESLPDQFESPLDQLTSGTRLYKYELVRKIGDGTFSDVWLARDHAIGCEYAIKILIPDIPIYRNLREAYIGHTLDHENVVRVHQADIVRFGQQDIFLIAMDYMPNGPITKLANSSLCISLPEVIRVTKDILRGLEYLHANGLLHNDIKPENILIGPKGQGMLTDYGIVGYIHDDALGVPIEFYRIHVAPEVITQNVITIQTDIFQVGLTLFRMLVGLDSLRIKFSDLGEQGYYDSAANFRLISDKDFPPHIPSRIRRIIRRAIHPDPKQRFASTTLMRRELEKLNYCGFWTINDKGNLVGHDGKYTYRYELIRMKDGKWKVESFRRNIMTNKETRCGKHCHRNLTKSVARKEISRFINAVINGR